MRKIALIIFFASLAFSSPAQSISKVDDTQKNGNQIIKKQNIEKAKLNALLVERFVGYGAWHSSLIKRNQLIKNGFIIEALNED